MSDLKKTHITFVDIDGKENMWPNENLFFQECFSRDSYIITSGDSQMKAVISKREFIRLKDMLS